MKRRISRWMRRARQGSYTGGAKLMLLKGGGAKIAPDAITARLDSIRDDVHQVQAAAVSDHTGQRIWAGLYPR